MSIRCMFCDEKQKDKDSGQEYPPYSYDDWVCENCWNNCPKCGCSEWKKQKRRSSRRHNKKICKNCGFDFITKPASG